MLVYETDLVICSMSPYYGIIDGLRWKSVIQDLAGGCYKVKPFHDTAGTLEIPQDSTLPADVSILTANYICRVGMSKKRHIKLRSESEPSRRNPYRCGRWGSQDGPNRSTCRLFQNFQVRTALRNFLWLFRAFTRKVSCNGSTPLHPPASKRLFTFCGHRNEGEAL